MCPYCFEKNGLHTPNCEVRLRTEIRITEFNEDMSKDERNYYGEEFDETR